MKFLYLFLRTWITTDNTFGEAWGEASEIIKYKQLTGYDMVRPWEDPNDFETTRGPMGWAMGGALRPICHKKKSKR